MAKNTQTLESSRWVGWRLENPKTLAQAALIAAVFVLGGMVWSMPPLQGLSETANHFLATLVVAVAFWMLEVFDEYIVGLLLLLAWVVLRVVPAKVALGGFSESSWFFVIGALGIAAALGMTPILRRLSIRLLSWIPIHCHKTYSLLLLSAGLLSGPLLPTGKARVSVGAPLSQSIADAAGFGVRSNGSASIALSAFIGFGEMSFMFLTGGELCLIGWNFLPAHLKVEFGWLAWFIAALPAALSVSLFVFLSIQFFLPLSRQEKEHLARLVAEPKLVGGAPLSQKELITAATLSLTVAGWMTTAWHGISETWVALAGLLVLLITGVLDKDGFKSKVDWGLILFFGVLNSVATVANHLKVDRWFTNISTPFLTQFSDDPMAFLTAVFVLVSFGRFILRKTAAVAFFAITLLPLSQSVGIHPGVMLVTIVMAAECFLLGYQDGPYQIAYAGGGGTAFSHAQARKILAAKYLATLVAIAVSVPYWRMLELIR